MDMDIYDIIRHIRLINSMSLLQMTAVAHLGGVSDCVRICPGL